MALTHELLGVLREVYPPKLLEAEGVWLEWSGREGLGRSIQLSIRDQYGRTSETIFSEKSLIARTGPDLRDAIERAIQPHLEVPPFYVDERASPRE